MHLVFISSRPSYTRWESHHQRLTWKIASVQLFDFSFPFGIWCRVGFWIQQFSSKPAWIYEWIKWNWNWLTDMILKGSGNQPNVWSKDSQVIHIWQLATNNWGSVKLSEALTKASQSAPESASKVLSATSSGNSVSNLCISRHFSYQKIWD